MAGGQNPEDGPLTSRLNPKTSKVVRWLPMIFNDRPKISERSKKASEYFHSWGKNSERAKELL